MKIKILIIFLILIFNILNFQSEAALAEGIIIADDQKIIDIFKAHDQSGVLKLAESIKEYDKVILHLGAQKVFARGHPFFYRTSRENLKIFAEELQAQNQDFYLWFLDSFGSEMFLGIYDQHQEIIDANYKQLQELNLNYQGIVIDIEWINLGSEDETVNNQNKYLEVLEYLRNKFESKKIYAFMSIVDDQQENLRRGYNEEEVLEYLDNIIVMLYLKDSGFYYVDGELNMILKEARIKKLRDYYQSKNYQTAVSLEGGIFLERNENLYFIKTANSFVHNNQSQLLYSKEKEYYIISGYRPETEISFKRNDGKLIEVNKDDRLHFLEIKADNLLDKEDYIWEYFQLQQ